MADAQKNPEISAIINGTRDVDAAAEEVVSGPKPAGAVAAEVLDPVAAWAEIPALVGQLLGAALPELKAVYSPPACRAWGEAMHRLALKRHWAADGVPPEVGVALASAMFVIPTAMAIKMRRDQAKRAREAQQVGNPGESQPAGGVPDGAAEAQ